MTSLESVTRVRKSKIVMNLAFLKKRYIYEKLSVQISLVQPWLVCLLLKSMWADWNAIE